MSIKWIVAIMMFGMSAVLLMGKGAFLIAGYNTASKKEKAKYDEKKLCRVTGIALLVATLSMFVQNQVLAFFLPMVAILFMFVAANFFCLRKDIEVVDIEDDPAANLIKKGSMVLTIVIFFGVGVMLFSGDVNVEINDKSLRVSGFMSSSTFVEYTDIESIELTDEIDSSSRVGGYGGYKVNTGNFENEEFGKYKRYTYNNCDNYVVIKTKDKYVVFNMENEKDTEKYYERILEKCGYLLS